MKIDQYLTKQISASMTPLVKGIAGRLADPTPFDNDTTFVARVHSATTVMKGVGGMDETLRLLSLLIVSRCGARGLDMVDWVAEAMGNPVAPVIQSAVADTYPKPVSSPAQAPVVIMTPDVAPKPAAPAPVTTVTATAPARKLPEGGIFKQWLKELGDFLGGNKPPSKGLQSLTSRVFRGDHKLAREAWDTLFVAMKKAAELRSYIVGNEADPYKVFASAPTSLLDDYLFGQESVVISVTAEVVDCVGVMPGWLCAKSSITMDAVLAFKVNKGLDEQSGQRVEKFVDAIVTKNGPPWLIEKGQSLLGAAAPETVERVHQQAQVSNHAIAHALVSAGIVEAPPQKKISVKKQQRVERMNAREASKLPVEKFTTEGSAVQTVEATSSVEPEAAPVAPPAMQEGGKPMVDEEFDRQFAELMLADEAAKAAAVPAPVNGVHIPPTHIESAKPVTSVETIQ